MQGLPTGAGNATVRAAATPATENATAVQRLLDAGSDLVGTTITVEFAWSLTGRNPHDGLADNPADPHGVPGGSSAGAAAATAAGLCDLALGSDTGGSVRVPSAYCNLYGIRPTHGRVDDTGVFPLSPMFDTVGWFARSPTVLRTAADVLLDDPAAAPLPDGVTVLTDAFAQASTEVQQGLDVLVGAVADQVGGALIDVEFAESSVWDGWAHAFGVLQQHEAFSIHGDFWRAHGAAALGDDVASRFASAERLTDQDAAECLPAREQVLERVMELTEGGAAVVLLPAAPTRAPRRAVTEFDNRARTELIRLTSIASMAGAPSVTIPSVTRTGTPVGLSLLGAPGCDEMLLDLASRVHEFLSF